MGDPVLVVVARLEGKVDAFSAHANGKLESLTTATDKIGSDIETLERRVGSLESWRNRLAGALGVMMFIATLLTYYIVSHSHLSIQT